MASTTRKQLRQRLLELLGDPVIEVVATSGSSTSILEDTSSDSVLGTTDDIWNDHYVYVAKDAGGANAAPEGQERRASDYVGSTQKISLNYPLTTALAVSDEAELTARISPLIINRCLDQSLLRTGENVRLSAVDTVSAIAGDYDYAMSFLDINSQVEELEIEFDTSKASYPYKTLSTRDYEIRNDEGTFTLQLKFDPAESLTIRVKHYKWHTQFTKDTDTTTLPEYLVLMGARAEVLFALANAQTTPEAFRAYYTLAREWDGKFESALRKRGIHPKSMPMRTLRYQIPELSTWVDED